MQDDRVIRRAELESMLGLTERQIRTLEGVGKFPRRFAIVSGGRAIGWSNLEIQRWLRERREAREQVHKPGMAEPGQRVGA